MAKNYGVSLRETNLTGRKCWREEAKADGGKRMLRRRVRYAGQKLWRREVSAEILAAGVARRGQLA